MNRVTDAIRTRDPAKAILASRPLENNMRWNRRSLCLLPLAVASCVHGQPLGVDALEGEWRGTWTKRGAALPVIVRFTRNGDSYSGSFDSADLQVVGIPFQSVERTGQDVHFVLAGDTSTTIFQGALIGDRVAGAFQEGDTAGEFVLVRAETPSPPLSVRPIRYANGSVNLSGEIISRGQGGPVPGVVFLHGSGGEGRWANRYLASRFARAGFAALIFDKRGVGESSGDWRTSGFDVLAADGAAAMRALASQPECDASRIGFYGHSQGGNIAPLAAAAGHAKFVIGSAASGVSPAETEIYSVANAIGARALPDADRADAMVFVRTLVAVGYDGAPRSGLDDVVARFRERSWFFEPPPAHDPYWAFSRQIASYDPVSAWSAVEAPVMLLWGALDERVPAQASSDALSAALARAGNGRVAARIYAGADHTFHLPDPDAPWPRRAPAYVEDMLAWALAASARP
jgi:uncharacterized protein